MVQIYQFSRPERISCSYHSQLNNTSVKEPEKKKYAFEKKKKLNPEQNEIKIIHKSYLITQIAIFRAIKQQPQDSLVFNFHLIQPI